VRFRYEVIVRPNADDLAVVARDWPKLQTSCPTAEAIYQSKAWFEHLHSATDSEIMLVQVFDEDDRLVGHVPVRIVESHLSFWITSIHQLRCRYRCARILGSQPNLPDDPDCHMDVVREILKAAPACDCVVSKTVKVNSAYHRALEMQGHLLSECLIYYPNGERAHPFVELPEDFGAYLRKFSSKTRNTLRRKLKKITARFGKAATLERFTSEASAGRFVRLAAQVSATSWQHRELGPRIVDDDTHRRDFADLARRGLLRSYVLFYGGEPCAFVVGYQHEGVFHYADVAYDGNLVAYSPGTMLVYLLIEDLISHDRPRTLDFGIGDAAYKKFWGTSTIDVVSVWVFRKTPSNAFIVGTHRLFRSVVRRAKRLFRARYEGTRARNA